MMTPDYSAVFHREVEMINGSTSQVTSITVFTTMKNCPQVYGHTK